MGSCAHAVASTCIRNKKGIQPTSTSKIITHLLSSGTQPPPTAKVQLVLEIPFEDQEGTYVLMQVLLLSI